MKTRLRSDGSKTMPASARLSTTSISAMTADQHEERARHRRVASRREAAQRHQALAASRLALPPAAVVSMQRCRSTAVALGVDHRRSPAARSARRAG